MGVNTAPNTAAPTIRSGKALLSERVQNKNSLHPRATTKAARHRYEVIFTVPQAAAAGDRISCNLPDGSRCVAEVPQGYFAGERFTVIFPPLPPKASIKNFDQEPKHCKCDFCGRKFKNATHLRIHSNVHNRAVPAKTDRQQIIPHVQHIRLVFIKNKEEPQQLEDQDSMYCQHCGLSFKSQLAFEVHSKRMHKDSVDVNCTHQDDSSSSLNDNTNDAPSCTPASLRIGAPAVLQVSLTAQSDRRLLTSKLEKRHDKLQYRQNSLP